jgi:hypothetical protein
MSQKSAKVDILWGVFKSGSIEHYTLGLTGLRLACVHGS